jgi:hypothetical protein
MGHDVMLDASWKWLPKTQLYLQGASGYTHYLNEPGQGDPTRFASVPVRVIAGLRGLLTEKVAVNLGVGYATAFYDGGEQPGGLSNLAGLVEINYKPTVFTDFTLGYRHEFRNSIVSNFVDVDAIYLGIRQAIAQRISVQAYGRFELRRYSGIDRSDSFALGGLTADYFVQEWFYAGIAYVLMYNQSEGDPNLAVNYAKHQVFFRLGFIY